MKGISSEGYTPHHTLFKRETMVVQPESRAWHNHPGMIVVMPEVDKKALIRELPGLPLPSQLLARCALFHLESLPDSYGRLDMFRSVTHLMNDIADRQPDTFRGAEAALFAEHFDSQKNFFGGALNKQQEDEFETAHINVINLAEYGKASFEQSPILLSSASIDIKKSSRLESEPNQDCVLVDDAKGIYGVFDGLGGNGGDPAAAAAVARDAIAKSLSFAGEPKSLDDMKMTLRVAFGDAREAVMKDGKYGSTTATVAWHTRLDNQDYWVMGNAGDSRSYMYDRTAGEVKSLTSNQGRGRVLDNCFQPSPWGRDDRADEFIVVPFDATNRLMLCSDGITGDTMDQMLSEEQFLDAFSQSTAFEAANSFVKYSKKDDDKSIIVVDVNKST